MKTISLDQSKIDFLNLGPIRIVAVVISCIISWITISRNPVLNPDAFKYIKAAETFSQHGLESVINEYGWFGYSIVISLVANTLSLSHINSGHLINTALYGILIWAFISLVMEYKTSKTLPLFAALTILCFPTLNEIRYNLIRDVGFWAFSIVGLLHLVRYTKSGNILNGIYWCIALLLAAFFRLEALIFLLIAPISQILSLNKHIVQDMKKMGMLYLLVIASTVICYVIFTFANINLVEVGQFAYRYYLPLIFDFASTVNKTSDNLNSAIFTPEFFPGNSGHGIVILFFAYIYIVILDFFQALGFPYTLLFIASLLFRSSTLTKESQLPLTYFILSSLFSLLIFISIMHFLTQRYAIVTSLFAISIIPIFLETKFQQYLSDKNLKRFYTAFGFLACYCLIDSLFSFGYSKDYMIDAAQWSQKNIPRNSDFKTNSYMLAYESGLIEDYDLVNTDKQFQITNLKTNEYIALVIFNSETNFQNNLEKIDGLILINEFSNKRNDKVSIFQYLPE